jgi:hypothetical protein
VDAAVGAGGERRVVGHHDYGLAVGGDVAEVLKYLFGRGGIEGVRRLVGHDDLRAVGKRAGDGDALGLAAPGEAAEHRTRPAIGIPLRG